MQEIIVELPIFTAKRLEKIPQEDFLSFLLKNTCNCLYNCATIALKERRKSMANRHRADLKLLTLWLPIEYYCQLKKLAAERKQSMSELVEFEIYKMAKNVKLTSEDRKAIDEEIRRNEERGRPPRR